MKGYTSKVPKGLYRTSGGVNRGGDSLHAGKSGVGSLKRFQAKHATRDFDPKDMYPGMRFPKKRKVIKSIGQIARPRSKPPKGQP